jgi:glycosyltransferase involved in cell wall biosynthesis
MKILVVSQYFWPENFRINELAASMVERGHSVTVLTGIPNYPEGKFAQGYGFFKKLSEVYKGVRIVRVPLIPRGSGSGLRLLLNYVSYFVSASIIGPFRCNEPYDLVFICQLSPVTVALPAIVFKKLKHAPMIMWILDIWPESLSATGAVTSPKILEMVGHLVRYIYRHCDLILSASRGFISKLTDQRVLPSKIEYFPNWVEEEYLPVSTAEAERRLNLPQGFRVVFAGNIGAAQDFETILDAAELLRDVPEIQWIIVGDGRKVKWVAKQIADRGLERSFHLQGRHPAEAMPYFFAAANVMPVTLKDNPVFSLTVPGKIQSYLACGRPIVASIAGEGRVVIEEANAGLVCSPGDSRSLADIVLTMYRMEPAEREKMGISGKRYAESHFMRATLADKLNSWLEDVVVGHKENT